MRVGLDDGDVVLLGDLDLDADCVLRLRVVVAGEVHADDALHMLLVILVLAQEVLDVLVLGEGELRERQDRRVELQGVELVHGRRLGASLIGQGLGVTLENLNLCIFLSFLG